MPPVKRRIAVSLALLAAAGTGSAALAAVNPNAVGPHTRIQPNGRQLAPYGHTTQLGNHPGGGALTPDGRFLWALDSGRGRNDIRIVDSDPALACRSGKRGSACRTSAAKKRGRVIQTIPMPGLSGGITMARDGRTAYVSGVADSPHEDERAPGGTPGLKGDTIHVFTLNAKTGRAARAGTIDVPPPAGVPVPPGLPSGFQIAGSPAPQSFPPTTITPLSWPRDLAVSPDGHTLLAALNLADRAALIDLRTKAVTYIRTGSYPYGAAITRDGKLGLVSNESDGTVSVIDLATKKKVKDITVGAHLSHPEGMAADPKADRAYVAVTAEDAIAVIDTKRQTVSRRLSVARSQGNGAQPTQLSVTKDGCRLLSADSGEDAVAVFALRSGCDTPRPKPAAKKKPKKKHPHRHGQRGATSPSFTGKVAVTKAFTLVGRVPTDAYPTFAGASPKREDLAWIAAKGVGVGPNPNGPDPLSPLDTDDNINSFNYLPSIVSGRSGTGRFPTDKELRSMSKVANAELKPINAQPAPAGTPLAPGGPIKHVFYVVRENRTYDQVLGDDPRGNGDPRLAIFGRGLTPNAHALAQRFPLLDHVFANSEASIDGHFWTSAGAVSDYVVKNWHANYAARGRPYDFGVYSVTWPAKRFLFDQAAKQGIPYFNYGEAIAGTVPFPDKDRTPEETQQVAAKFAHSDLGEAGVTLAGVQAPSTNCYPNDASIGKDAVTGQEVYDSTAPVGQPGALSRVECFRQKFAIQQANGSVPAFNYLVLTNDHTNGLAAGRRTPQAMVADNDYALGELVDTISHSSVWNSSMILVMEDDSQDGADHLDAHRIPAFAISPYTKRAAVVHTRYDFPSLIKTLELPIGMKPLTLYDALATPLYDAFSSSASNSEPYTALPPTTDLNARNANTATNRRLARKYNLTATDQVPQNVLDRMLWHAVRGRHSTPPHPGPNAQREKPGEDDDG
jgi:YVTN family beta-propeller protein